MNKPIEVTVRDPNTGETDTKELQESDYIILCGERRYVGHTQLFPTAGTAIVTIKTLKPGERIE